MSWRATGFVLLLAGRAMLGGAQGVIVVQNAGSGPGTEILPLALQSPYTLIAARGAPYAVAKGASIDKTLIVVGRDAVVEGVVHGDVIVVNGALVVHPSAAIDGRAIAIGGSVYPSSLAHVGGGTVVLHEFSYDVANTANGVSLSFRSTATPTEWIGLPGLSLLRLPAYDRANGLSLPVAQSLFLGRRLRAEPRATYRSQLGRVDPWLDVVDSIGGGGAIAVSGGRGTFTNDAWFRGNLVNSLETLALGNDARNYFRGTRGDAQIAWASDSGARGRSIYAGVRGEHGLSVRPGDGALSGPWSVIGKRDSDDMLRPNPAVDNGVIESILAGARIRSVAGDIRTRGALDVELGNATGDRIAGQTAPPSKTFAQATFDASIAFPTFGTQSLRFAGHAVFTSHGATPRQRWAYLGGPGTLPTLELLSLGGDQLVFLDGNYAIPISGVELPLLGPPVVSLNDAIGGAGVGKIPSLHQNVGARLAAGDAYVEVAIDPVTRLRHFTGGFSLAP